MRNLLFFLFGLFTMFTFSQSTGTVSGLVQDKDMDLEPLPFVSVYVQENPTLGTTTDFDGVYSLQLKPGNHTIVFDYVGYKTIKKPIVVKAGINQKINLVMASAADALDAIILTAVVNKESEAALVEVQKEAVEIKESIGAEQLSKAGVSNAAAATTKIAGVQKNEASGDVFVRGLGDRYLYTSLNGLPVPSDDIDKKNISLSLFSTGIIQNVGISKTFSVNSYGDQTSGHVDVNSKEYSKGDESIKVGFSSGINSNVAGQLSSFGTSQGVNNSTLGFYKNKTSLTESVSSQSWNAETVNLPIDYKISVAGGKSYDLNDKRDELSFTAFLSHGKSFDYYSSEQANFGENSLKTFFNDVEEFNTKTTSTAMASLKYRLGKNNTFDYVSLFINKLTDVLLEGGRNGEGYGQGEVQFETGVFVRDQNVKQSQILINQFLGKHILNDKNEVKWGVGINNVNANEPNRIRNVVNILPSTVRYVNTSNFAQRKSAQEITDNEINGFANYKFIAIDEENKTLNFNAGFNTRQRTRDFSSKFVGVETGIVFAGDLDNFSDVINNGIADGSFNVIDRDEETYKAELKINAAYLSSDFKFNNTLFGLGLRFENDVIDLVEWNTLLGGQDSSKKTYNNLLPSLTVKHELDENNMFRLAASKTITLPEFKELAPFDYTSPTGNISIGNTELQPSTNYNLDLKWELFLNKGELISVTSFYKLIENPINNTRRPDSSGYFTYDNTGDKANVYGLEIEAKLDVYESETFGKINTSSNVTLMAHEQNLIEKYQYNGKSVSGLAGASNAIINFGATYSNQKEKELVTTISANCTSDKIFALGTPGTDASSNILFNDEVVEKSVFTLDWIISKKFNDHLSLKGAVKNILNPDIQRVQNITTTRRGVTPTTVFSYKRGVDFSVGVNYSF